ncbi:hypothetical protein BGZ80_009859 [Entomortierella chlamydospora]|uniref:DNA helicase n=1 Tax=Entomortierella chlamydospora TaxID=101097 RepID=A0A9P6T405_9FUNG|nr:hypothetical protein BGZ79_003809 [Entomortierella chlamydospora]KAG0023289.1 hypothetical protein BGZ80_009859 [Entomortierella chlamydospora]
MSAMQRLQEYRYKKMQESATASRSTPTAKTSQTTLASRTSSLSVTNTNGSAKAITKEPTVVVLDSDDIESESDIDLRRGVKEMTTHSPTRPNHKPTTDGSASSSSPAWPLKQTTLQKSLSSQSKNGFKELVTSYRYTGKDALPPPPSVMDSDHSLTSPGPSDDDTIMLEGPTKSATISMDKSSSHSKSVVKRQIISSDEEQVEEVKPRRRLVRKVDMASSTTSEAPKRRRLVKRMTLDSSEDEEQNSRSGSTTIQVSDEEPSVDETLDQKLAQLQTTFPYTPFDHLKKALNEAGGDFAKAASKLVYQSSADIFNISPKSSNGTRPTNTLNSLGSTKQGGRLHQSPSKPASKPASTPVSTPVSTPKKKKNGYSSDGSEDSFDDEGPNKYKNQDRKEQRALQFFNESTMLELQELSGCSKAQANGVIGLRPFDNFDHLCVTLRKTKGVGEKIVNNYLTTSDAIRAVDMMLKTVDRVREDLASTLSVWCGDGSGKLFQNPTSGSNGGTKEASGKGKDGDDDDEDSEPGMELLEIDADKLEQTAAGKKAMEGFIRKQPSNMSPTFQLKGYQLLGINWLALLWRKKLSGILADEMGLGKTAQVIAFLAHLLENGEQGPFLIIVPASVLDNWLREFENFCPQIDVRSYYGSQAEREEIRDQLEEDPTYNVIVTTYAIATGNNDERKFLNRRRFKGVVLDEGHMLKNCMSARYKQLMSIKTPFRLLLTGTPLQNNLEELLSLLIFILPDLFAEHEEVLRTMFKVKVDANSEKSTLLSQERIVRARHMLAPFVLRRKKIHVISMPRKIQNVIYCDLHPDQRVLYDRIISSSELRAALGEDESDREPDPIELDSLTPKAKAKAAKKGPTKKEIAASKKVSRDQFANMLMQLRKAADHPMLFRELYTDATIKKMAKAITKEVEFCDSNITYIEEDMSVMTDFEIHRMCKQFKSINKFALSGDQWMHAGKVQELERLLPKLIYKQKSRVLIFSQFTMVLDILESILKTMDITFLRMDGQTKVEERQPMIDSFNDDDTYKIFLLSTKAGGFGINLTGANVVIMYDLDFNPHNDKQAEDRAHRVGQTRDVEVIKLISKDTIEEQIYQLANLKLKLDQHVSQDDAAIKELDNSSSSSGSSTPSAGILSLIKQNWKATYNAALNRQESSMPDVVVVENDKIMKDATIEEKEEEEEKLIDNRKSRHPMVVKEIPTKEKAKEGKDPAATTTTKTKTTAASSVGSTRRLSSLSLSSSSSLSLPDSP